MASVLTFSDLKRLGWDRDGLAPADRPRVMKFSKKTHRSAVISMSWSDDVKVGLTYTIALWHLDQKIKVIERVVYLREAHKIGTDWCRGKPIEDLI